MASGFAAKWGITPGEVARKPLWMLCLRSVRHCHLLASYGPASIWAFVGNKYPNVPEDVTPAVSHSVAPAYFQQANTTQGDPNALSSEHMKPGVFFGLGVVSRRICVCFSRLLRKQFKVSRNCELRTLNCER